MGWIECHGGDHSRQSNRKWFLFTVKNKPVPCYSRSNNPNLQHFWMLVNCGSRWEFHSSVGIHWRRVSHGCVGHILWCVGKIADFEDAKWRFFFIVWYQPPKNINVPDPNWWFSTYLLDSFWSTTWGIIPLNKWSIIPVRNSAIHASYLPDR